MFSFADNDAPESDIVENGHAIEVSPGHVQLGPLAKLSRTPAQPALSRDVEALLQDWAGPAGPVPRR